MTVTEGIFEDLSEIIDKLGADSQRHPRRYHSSLALSNDQLADGGIQHTQGHQNKDRAAHTRQKLGPSTTS